MHFDMIDNTFIVLPFFICFFKTVKVYVHRIDIAVIVMCAPFTVFAALESESALLFGRWPLICCNGIDINCPSNETSWGGAYLLNVNIRRAPSGEVIRCAKCDNKQ